MPIHMDSIYHEDTELAEFYIHGELLATLQFQHGMLSESGVNGITNEAVIEVLIDRMRVLNRRLPCRENSIVITKLQEALFWLEQRTRLRENQGVEDTNEPHDS